MLDVQVGFLHNEFSGSVSASRLVTLLRFSPVSQRRGDPQSWLREHWLELAQEAERPWSGSAQASHLPVPQPWAARSFRQPALYTPRSPPSPGSNALRSSSVRSSTKFSSPPRHTSGEASALPRRGSSPVARLSEIPPNPHARISATSSRLSRTRLKHTSASAANLTGIPDGFEAE